MCSSLDFSQLCICIIVSITNEAFVILNLKLNVGYSMNDYDWAWEMLGKSLVVFTEISINQILIYFLLILWLNNESQLRANQKQGSFLGKSRLAFPYSVTHFRYFSKFSGISRNSQSFPLLLLWF